METKEININEDILINNQGYAKSERGAKDGCCFFGTMGHGGST